MASFASEAVHYVQSAKLGIDPFWWIFQYLCFDGGGFLVVSIVLTEADIESRPRACDACSCVWIFNERKLYHLKPCM